MDISTGVVEPKNPTANFSPSPLHTFTQRPCSTHFAYFDPILLAMIPSTLFALVAALSSLAATNGAVIQRDGTFVSHSA
jgi:hypothetical protein